MTSRLAVWGVVAALMLGNAGALRAQGQDDVKGLTEAVKALTAQVTTLNSTVQGTTGALNAMHARLNNAERNVAAMQNDVAGLKDLQGEVNRLRDDFKNFQEFVVNQNEQINTILQAVSTRDASGRPIPNLRAIRQNAEAREEFAQTVREAVPLTGTLRLRNQTAEWRTILINGVAHDVAPGAVRDVSVPVGAAVTELRPWEGPKTRTIAPGAVQEVNIYIRMAPPAVAYDIWGQPINPWPY